MRFLFFLTSSSLLLLIGYGAMATSFFVPPFPEKLESSPNIVRGVAGKSESRWVTHPGGQEQIFTFTSLQVTEVLKGQISAQKNQIQVRTYGGQMGDVGMNVPGSAQFVSGEDLVLMLTDPHADGSYSVIGMTTGRFSVKQSENGEAYLEGMGLNSSSKGLVQFPQNHEENIHNKSHSDASQSTRWTLKKVRSILSKQSTLKTNVKSQTSLKSGKSMSQPKHGFFPTKSDDSVAPALQPPEEDSANQDDSESNYFAWIVLLVLGLIVGGTLIWRRAKGRSGWNFF